MLNTLIVIRQQCFIVQGLLKRYTKVWGKISSLIRKEFDNEPVYGDNDKYIKAKIKSYGDKVNTNSIQGEKITKENVSYKCCY